MEHRCKKLCYLILPVSITLISFLVIIIIYILVKHNIVKIFSILGASIVSSIGIIYSLSILDRDYNKKQIDFNDTPDTYSDVNNIYHSFLFYK